MFSKIHSISISAKLFVEYYLFYFIFWRINIARLFFQCFSMKNVKKIMIQSANIIFTMLRVCKQEINVFLYCHGGLNYNQIHNDP